jgi:UDP-glucose 4-epimerase
MCINKCCPQVPYVVAPRRPGDLSVLYASTEKAKAELNWVATRSLDDMCDSLWKWQSDNPSGYPEDARFFRHTSSVPFQREL